MRVITLFLSATLCFIMASMTRTVRGYDIRIQRTGENWMGEVKHAWSEKGILPQEWEAVKQDPTVEKAVIHYGTERRKQSQKRNVLDQYPQGD